MSATHPTAKKLVQISEEMLPPLNVPFVLGNEYYVMTQQDVRRLEDTRFISLKKLQPNGDLYPIQVTSIDFFLQLLKKYNDSFNTQNGWSNCEQKVYPQPMDISTSGTFPCAMGVEQQLNWDKCSNKSAPFPFSYSRGTSTTELCYINTEPTMHHAQHSKCNNLSKKVTFCSGTNTQERKSSPESCCLSAREQLKQKKMLYSHMS